MFLCNETLSGRKIFEALYLGCVYQDGENLNCQDGNFEISHSLNITAGGLISGRRRQGWRVFCQSW
jgi:hypothetical protein